jgi:hypothetical protein
MPLRPECSAGWLFHGASVSRVAGRFIRVEPAYAGGSQVALANTSRGPSRSRTTRSTKPLPTSRIPRIGL